MLAEMVESLLKSMSVSRKESDEIFKRNLDLSQRLVRSNHEADHVPDFLFFFTTFTLHSFITVCVLCLSCMVCSGIVNS
jgi:hypothetical protein